MGTVEQLGISHLGTFLNLSDYIEPDIRQNDKTPSWDGEIRFYKKPGYKKCDLAGRVAVQVKSTSVQNLDDFEPKVRFSIVDLNAYFEDGGILIFLIGCQKKNHLIAYKFLLPFDIKGLLKTANDRKSVAISLELLDLDDTNRFENETQNFILHRKLQYSYKDIDLSIDESKEYITTFIYRGFSLDNYLLTHPILLYEKVERYDFGCFVEKFLINEIKKEFRTNVLCNGDVYFSKYEVRITNQEKQVIFGKSITVDIENSLLTYKPCGNLKELINASRFLQALLVSNEVHFENSEIAPLKITLNSRRDELAKMNDQTLELLIGIEKILNHFKVDPEKLILENGINGLDDQSKKNLDLLYNLIILKKDVDFFVSQQGFYLFQIGNIYLGLFIYKAEDETKFRIRNSFEPFEDLHFTATTKDGEKTSVSPLVFLQTDFLIKSANLDLNLIYQELIRFELNETYANLANMLGLNLLKSYDFANKSEYLDCAKEIFEWIINVSSLTDICRLNILQVVSRLRKLSPDEIESIIEMKGKYSDDYKMLFGINVLLRNLDEAKYYFEKMSELLQDEFKEYPIFTLANKYGVFQ